MTNEGLHLIKAEHRIQAEEIQALEKAHTMPLAQLFSRVTENATRVALIRAVLRDYRQLSIDLADIRFGLFVARFAPRTLLSYWRRNKPFVNANDRHEHARMERVMGERSAVYPAGLSRTELGRKSRVKGDALQRVADALQTLGQIRIELQPSTGGRKQQVFFATSASSLF